MSEENKETKETHVKGFALTADELTGMPDKHFKIHSEPYYRTVKTMDGKGEEEKLIIPVTLSNGVPTEWYANKTSQRIIIAQKGRVIEKWVGFEGEFKVVNQMVGKDERKVIYLVGKIIESEEKKDEKE